MDIFNDLQINFSNVWVVLGVAALVLVLGWLLSRRIARIGAGLLKRTGIVDFLVARLNLPDRNLIDQRIRQFLRILVVLLAAWGSWQILNGHPDIAAFISSAWEAIRNFVQFPAVVFVLNLALIALETFLLFKALGWVKAGFQIVADRIRAERGKRLRGFKIQQVQMFSAEQLTSFLLVVNQYARYAVNILLFFIYLTGVFSVFPGTRGIVSNVLAGIFQIIDSGWQDFVGYLPSLLNLIVIVVVTYYGIRLIRFLFNEVEKGTITLSGFFPEWANPTYQLVRFLVIAFALVIAFPYLPGSSSPAFQGISVFVGLLFSLGSTSVVANIVSGVVLTYTRAFNVGDRVKIADTVGDVIEKGLLVTRMRTIKNVEITIPNGMVMGSHIINYSAVSQERGLILNTTVTLGYEIPWRKVHETLKQAAQATNGILSEPAPFILQTSLDDFYVSYELNAYTDQPNKMAVVYSDLHQNIQDACNEAGIEILSPHYGALRDGNASTIPSENLPKNYQAPPFHVDIKKEK